MTDSLLDETRKLLAKDKRRLATISRDTDLPYFWLRNFKLRVFKNPAISRVEKLHKALTHAR